jgi:plastocyanin domain-containing protein
MMTVIVNLVGILLILAVAWWFWFSKAKAENFTNNKIQILVKDGVYSPARIQVTSEQDVTLEFLRKDSSGCSAQLLIESLNIHSELPLNKKQAIHLGKLKPGNYAFTCQMKMYQGSLEVVAAE